jgi:glycosyltransferase involved in cell wall biosynthesis
VTAVAAECVSVVIPTFNRANAVERALHSVLSQEGVDAQVIVVDDGSTDDTIERLRGIHDPRLSVVPAPHRGVSAARNEGARRAKGRLLVFLDSDDEAQPGWLQTLSSLARGESLIACCGALIQEAGSTVENRRPAALGPGFGDVDGLFLAGTFAVDRELFLAVGGYCEDLHFGENTELAIRLVKACQDGGGRVIATGDELLAVNRLQTGVRSREYVQARFQAAKLILSRHPDAMEANPSMRARYLTIAGVDAARLGKYREARQHLYRAAVTARRSRSTARLIAVCVPVLRKHLWRTT